MSRFLLSFALLGYFSFSDETGFHVEKNSKLTIDQALAAKYDSIKASELLEVGLDNKGKTRKKFRFIKLSGDSLFIKDIVSKKPVLDPNEDAQAFAAAMKDPDSVKISYLQKVKEIDAEEKFNSIKGASAAVSYSDSSGNLLYGARTEIKENKKYICFKRGAVVPNPVYEYECFVKID